VLQFDATCTFAYLFMLDMPEIIETQ